MPIFKPSNDVVEHDDHRWTGIYALIGCCLVAFCVICLVYSCMKEKPSDLESPRDPRVRNNPRVRELRSKARKFE